jgi:hypothetical protein
LNDPLMISVLCGRERDGWINPHLADRLFQSIADGMASRRRVAVTLIEGVSPVEAARNLAVARFLPTPYQWLLMLDNDVVPPENFLKIFTEAESEGKFLFGVPTPMIGDAGLEWNVAHRQDEVYCAFLKTLPAGWHRCDFLGGSFLAARRPVYETIKSNWFDRLPNKGEDFSFCHRAQEAGFQPWFTGDYQCDHIHSGSLRELLQQSVRQDFVGTTSPGADVAP